MYQVSQAYKDSMKNPLRNRSYMMVSVGLINQVAQNTASVNEESNYSDYSDLHKVFTETEDFTDYASYEQNFWKADGNFRFLPKEVQQNQKNGLISKDLFSGSFSFRFDFSSGKQDIKGLTIQWGEIYPSSITIQTDSGTSNTYSLSSNYFETEDVFYDTSYIIVKVNSMISQNARVRLDYIKFGLGLEYDNEWIISAESKETLSAINEELPETSFSVTLNNKDKVFNVDNPNSAINYFEPGQEISVSYGYELDDGTIEWMPLYLMYIEDWNADDYEFNINAKDKMQFMDDTYYKGKYNSAGISLYNLAVNVLKDAGLTEEDYELDDYLKEILVNNPLPKVTHKECLQIIANAGKSILSFDRYGKIKIKSNFTPNFTSSSNGTESFSDASVISSPVDKTIYASYEQDFWKADGTYHFIPKENVKDAAYISYRISNSSGFFTTNPKITLTFEKSFKCYGFDIAFQENLPNNFTVVTYLEDSKKETVRFSDINEKKYNISHDFSEIDKMEIEFTSAKPNSRVKIDYISFGNETGYKLEYDDMLSSPVGTQLEKVKNLLVQRTLYSQASTLEQVVSEEVVYSGERLVYYFDDPFYSYQVSVSSGNYLIVSSGCYYIEIALTGLMNGSKTTITIKGYKYNVSTSYITKQVTNSGSDKTWENPLISSIDHANLISDWLYDYFSSSVEYEIEYRGEPALDFGDVITQESTYDDSVITTIEEISLSFNGTISGELTTRRNKDVARTKNKLEEFR